MPSQKSILEDHFQRRLERYPNWLRSLGRGARSVVRGLSALIAFSAILGLAGFSIFAVHVVTRETLREFYAGEVFGPCGLEYFVGPGILMLMFLGILKLREISPSATQKSTIAKFRLRAARALSSDAPDLAVLNELYAEGLAHRNKWSTDNELNEMIGVLRYILDRDSSKRFREKLMGER